MFNCRCQGIPFDPLSIAGAHRSYFDAMLLRRIWKDRRCTLIGRIFVSIALHWLLSFGAVYVAVAELAPLSDAKISPSSPAAPTPGPAATLEPIPLNDIAKRLENSRRLLKEIGSRDESSELAEIAQEAEATRNSFAKEVKAAEAAIARSLRRHRGPVPQRDLRLRAVDNNIEELITHGAVESSVKKDAYLRK